MTDSRRPWADREEQVKPREGAMYKPVHPENATRKEELDRIRGMQHQQDPAVGPTNHSSNPSG